MTISGDAFGGTVLDLAPGSTLGRYELLVPIAAGGMARVWAARQRGHAGFSKLVAVKMIRPELAEDPGFQQMFLDEARIASMVRHPNVCETYDLAETDGILYLAMEWVDGASLQRLLRDPSTEPSGPSASQVFSRTTHDQRNNALRLPIEPRVAARIMADACAGLHAAHELTGDDGTPLGVIHRDATPHNILIAADGRVKMSDFGVAKALGQSHATLAGQVKGKIAYMAPEQLCGDPMDRRADIFALGACLYETVIGRKAFIGDNDPEVMSKIMLGSFDPPQDILPDLPQPLIDIILRALAAEAKDRFQTAEEMQSALESYIASSGPPVLSSSVASVVRARCSAEIEKRRASIRGAVASPGGPTSQPAIAIEVSADPTTPDQPSGPLPTPPPFAPRDPALFESQPGKSDASVRMNGAVDLRAPSPPADSVKWAPIVAVAAVLAILSAGAGGFAIVRMRRASDADSSAAARASAMPLGIGSANAGAGALGSNANANANGNANANASGNGSGNVNAKTGASSGAKPIAAPSPQVAFHISPDTAILVVDGVALPRGITVVQRRTDETAQSVLVRADKYEDYVVLVDPETPADVEVALTPLATAGHRRRARPAGSGSAAPPTSASAAGPEVTPPNPYGTE